jgi:catechol 2,3-dioxygenase-like lactoylglutathione lyase family enzyme
MLSDAKVHPSLATADVARAKAWYAEKLGWQPTHELPGMLVYEVDGRILTVYESPNSRTAQSTVAAWRVTDLRAEVARLRARGLEFEELDLGDSKTVDGIAVDDEGDINAWFRDADGNWISVVEVNPKPDDPPAEFGPGLILAAADLDRARAWYRAKLGLTPYREYPGELLLYLKGNTRFSVYQTESAGTAKNTVGMWWVKDLRAEVAELRRRGVVFEEYDFGDARTVDGVLEDEDGLTAWFKDSEGNILGLGQYGDLAA